MFCFWPKGGPVAVGGAWWKVAPHLHHLDHTGRPVGGLPGWYKEGKRGQPGSLAPHQSRGDHYPGPGTGTEVQSVYNLWFNKNQKLSDFLLPSCESDSDKKRVSPKRIWPYTGPNLLFTSFCGPYRMWWAGTLMPDRPLWASWVRWTSGTDFWSRPRSSPWLTAVLTYPGMSSPGWPAMLRCLGGGHLSGPWRCVRTDYPIPEAHPSTLVFIHFHPSSVVIACCCCCSFLSSAQRWMSQSVVELWTFLGFYFEGWSVSKIL